MQYLKSCQFRPKIQKIGLNSPRFDEFCLRFYNSKLSLCQDNPVATLGDLERISRLEAKMPYQVTRHWEGATLASWSADA